MTRYDSMSCLVDPVPHANMTRLTHLHQLLPRIEGMDFELACHWPDLCIVQELPQVAFVVVGHPNLLHQTVLNATKCHLFRQFKKEASPEKLEAACLNFLYRDSRCKSSKAFHVCLLKIAFCRASSMSVPIPGQWGKTKSIDSKPSFFADSWLCQHNDS